MRIENNFKKIKMKRQLGKIFKVVHHKQKHMQQLKQMLISTIYQQMMLVIQLWLNISLEEDLKVHEIELE